MSRLKRALLHGLLFASFMAFPVVGFAAYNGESHFSDRAMEPKAEQTAARFRFGVYYGRPYYYRPYYYYYPYRPYYYRYNYNPYRGYRGYYW